MKRSTKTISNKRNDPSIVNTLNTPFLVIVESPSKCAKIEKYLGFQYKCIASKGHVRELKKVGSAKQHYVPSYDIISEKAEHVAWMRSVVSQFSPQNVFLGTDDDREGEAIAWHICVLCNLDPSTTKRILFHEVTAPALRAAVAVPCTLRMSIVRAQQARQILDRMIGFQISPVLSRLLVHDNAKFLSAGRCQTPTLRLVYDRYKQCETKEERIVHKIEGTFFSHPSTLNAVLTNTLNTEEDVQQFLENSQTHEHRVTIPACKEKRKLAPKPFSTSALLQAASTHLSMSPKYVMDGCQKLYQDGYITYMRTESQKYAESFVSQCKEYIQNHYGADVVGDVSDITNQDNQNPHEAIRVTQLSVKGTQYNDRKINELYALVKKRTVESCMRCYDYQEQMVHISSPLDKSVYEAIIEIPISLGWKRLTMTVTELHEWQQRSSASVAYYKRYDHKIIPYQKIASKMHQKDRDIYYQEAGLIQKLETLGIGRPSTFSMLVETIQERQYVKKEDVVGESYMGNEYTLENNEISAIQSTKTFGGAKNKLRIQPLGVQAIEWLVEHCGTLFDYDYTRRMEEALDELAISMTDSWHQVCLECEETIQTCLKPLKDKLKGTYFIDEHHALVFGKTGMMITCTEGDRKTYKSVRPQLEVNFTRLEKGDYTLEELLEVPRECLGIYDSKEVCLKTGPYGAYIKWGDSSVSVQKLVTKSHSVDQIVLEEVIPLLVESSQPKISKTIVREVSPELSVRKGKFGLYFYYKTQEMKKPSFVPLKKCPHEALTTDPTVLVKWVQETLVK